MRTLSLFLIAVLAACNAREPTAPPTTDAAAMPSFVNQVWVVADSAQVAKGDVRVFLADGTMVMASPQATTALGGWREEGGQLRITEEGIDYPVDVLSQSAEALHIRIRGPGEPVEIAFQAEGPVLHLSGTVKYLDISGGQYVISDAEGVNYSPMELAEAYRVDGRAIEVDARRRNDVMSIGMTGPIIEILRVR